MQLGKELLSSQCSPSQTERPIWISFLLFVEKLAEEQQAKGSNSIKT